MTTQDPVLNPQPIILGGLAGAVLGAAGMLVIGIVAGFEWWLCAIMAFQIAVSFGIVGGWVVATFAFDDESQEETAAEHTIESDVVRPTAVPTPLHVRAQRRRTNEKRSAKSPVMAGRR